jgi:hypothetical protein
MLHCRCSCGGVGGCCYTAEVSWLACLLAGWLAGYFKLTSACLIAAAGALPAITALCLLVQAPLGYTTAQPITCRVCCCTNHGSGQT